jgi:putative iron-only hydrogenase system regulator
MERRIGTVSVIITDRAGQAPLVNAVLSEFGEMIVGRMGMPYPLKGVHVISLIVDGTTDQIGAMTGKLGALKGVKVKSALTKA